MAWYTVTKKVKGRAYLYRQRSFRVGGKVRTESVYLGPADGGGGGGGQSAATDEAQASAVAAEPVITTTQEKAWEDTEPYLQPTFGMLADDAAKFDLSVTALMKEEARTRDQMEKHGLELRRLSAIHVAITPGLVRYRREGKYCVGGPAKGNRTAIKREFRHALADRWLQAVEDCDPVLYNSLRCEMSERHKQSRAALTQIILLSNTPHKFIGVLWFMWSGRLPNDLRKKVRADRIGMVDHEGGGWRDELVKLAADMIQHNDGEKVFRKYEARKNKAQDRYWLEMDKSQAMGMSLWFTKAGKAQRQREEKARVWLEACEAMERKVETVWTWYSLGEL